MTEQQATFVESYLAENSHDMDSQVEVERLTAKAVGLFKDKAIKKIKDWHEHHTDEYMQELNDDGMNMIITINDPDRWWLANREAFAYSIDFGWN